MAIDLPIDGDGACMRCKATPPEYESVLCRMCATPWHVPCLSRSIESEASSLDWLCPDCSGDAVAATGEAAVNGVSGDLVAKIRAIEADPSLDEKEKAKRRQALVSGKPYDEEEAEEEEEEEDDDEKKKKKRGDTIDLLGGHFKCSICKELLARPVTAPCGHNFCLKCFEKWVLQERQQGRNEPRCANCRTKIPLKIAAQPRINSTLVSIIRMAKSAKTATAGSSQVYHFQRNESRPDKAFTTERAKKSGNANACSGQIFVTVPPDHFGPIPAENDPRMNRGVLVGDTWADRLECRQWGAHFPHVAGIAGQSEHGAQSVALSGGYVDDEDHGEWFLYTGSGGRDLSGNKRTNKDQSFDQKFEKMNKSLLFSCMKGYPVRVVRSCKEKRSSYAPEKGVRYDGVYRIEKCWRKENAEGLKLCRYLFIRCDNEPAPWTSDDQGDRPRPLPVVKELKGATDLMERKESPSWDYVEEKGWIWVKPPPVSRKPVRTGDAVEQKRVKKAIRLAQCTSMREQLLKEFGCLVCKKVMTSPVTTPCAHNFCKECLLGSYADKSFVRQRGSAGGRTLRSQKLVKKCPSCPTDISDFLQNPKVNTELMELIETLKHQAEEEKLLEKEVTDEEGSDEDECEEEMQASAEETGDVDVKAPSEEDEMEVKVASEEVKADCIADDKKLVESKDLKGKALKRGGEGKPKSPPQKRRKTAVRSHNAAVVDGDGDDDFV